jgi:glycosyltransferase involved in cell wall biosynthesis
MHVLIAAHDFYPDPGAGGTGRYVYETARRLVDRGHEVSVVTRRRGDMSSRETVDGVDVYRYDIDVSRRRVDDVVRQLPGAAQQVLRYVNQVRIDGKPDVISFQGPLTAALVHLAADGDVPRSATFHRPWPTEYAIETADTTGPAAARRALNVRLRRRVEASVLARADDATTLSRYMRDELTDEYDAGLDPTVIPGGVDVDRFRPDAGAYAPLDGDGVSVLTVGRLSERTGHDLLLEAFAAVADRRPDAELYVAGDGPRRAELERRARALGIDDRTTFLGYVPDGDLPAAYATADVFALPTTQLEGFGLATLEALASETPVVATPVGGAVEVVGEYERRAGLPEPMLVESADADAFARGLASWLDLSADARADAGGACREVTAEAFPWAATADRLESHYADLAGTPRRREA